MSLSSTSKDGKLAFAPVLCLQCTCTKLAITHLSLCYVLHLPSPKESTHGLEPTMCLSSTPLSSAYIFPLNAVLAVCAITQGRHARLAAKRDAEQLACAHLLLCIAVCSLTLGGHTCLAAHNVLVRCSFTCSLHFSTQNGACSMYHRPRKTRMSCSPGMLTRQSVGCSSR